MIFESIPTSWKKLSHVHDRFKKQPDYSSSSAKLCQSCGSHYLLDVRNLLEFTKLVPCSNGQRTRTRTCEQENIVLVDRLNRRGTTNIQRRPNEDKKNAFAIAIWIAIGNWTITRNKCKWAGSRVVEWLGEWRVCNAYYACERRAWLGFHHLNQMRR